MSEYPLLDGFEATLEQLLMVPEGMAQQAPGRSIAYFIRFTNRSVETVQVLARKWVLEAEDGTKLVVEGEGVVGQRPRLEPGEDFSYHSHHQIQATTVARGTFFGRTRSGQTMRCELAPFRLKI